MNNREARDAKREAEECPSYEELEAQHPGLFDHEGAGVGGYSHASFANSRDFAELDVSGPDANTVARVATDGKIDMWLDVKKPLPALPSIQVSRPDPRPPAPPIEDTDCPPLNIVIFVVGSRGE